MDDGEFAKTKIQNDVLIVVFPEIFENHFRLEFLLFFSIFYNTILNVKYLGKLIL